MADMETYPWHCSCGRLNGKRHVHCPTCKAHWSVGVPHSNEPKSPRTYNYHEDQSEQWDWQNRGRKTQRKWKGHQHRPYDRSESARRSAKGGGKSKGNKGADPYAAPAISPWPSQDTSASTVQQAPVPPTASALSHAELLTAVRKNYPDITQAPEDIQRAVEKAEKFTSKALTTDLNKASKQVGKAARQLSQVKDARTSHRQNWLKHLKDSVVSWQKQLQLFKDQQKKYGDQLNRAQQELNTARRHLQQLNKQAAAVGAPLSTETGDAIPESAEWDTNSSFEMEAQALVQQVQECLQQSIAAASKTDEAMEVLSDEEDRRTKRPRSMEPFGGSGRDGGLDAQRSSSPKP